MSTHKYQSIIVTGVDSGDESEQVRLAHSRATDLFDDGLVSPMSPIGHNFIRSFCVFPSGSGNDRPAQLQHQDAVEDFVKHLQETDLDFVAVKWMDGCAPEVTHSHDEEPISKPKVK